jgi:hypothetical protein
VCVANEERIDDGYEFMSPWDRCITRCVPGGFLPAGYNNAYQIIQTPGYVVIHSEMIHDARIIPLDGRPHVPARERTWTAIRAAAGKGIRSSWRRRTTTTRAGSLRTRRRHALRASRKAKSCGSSNASRAPDPARSAYEATIEDPNLYQASTVYCSLLSNAVKFTREGGSISVRLDHAARDHFTPRHLRQPQPSNQQRKPDPHAEIRNEHPRGAGERREQVEAASSQHSDERPAHGPGDGMLRSVAEVPAERQK